MDPALGVLAGDPEPVGGGFGAGPAYSFARRQRVEVAEVGVRLLVGPVEQLDQHPGAEPPSGSDPLLVEAVEERAQRFSIDRPERPVAIALA
jgi:hypothetical protein